MSSAIRNLPFCRWWFACTLAYFAAVGAGQETRTDDDTRATALTNDEKIDELSPFYFEKKLDRATDEFEFLRNKATRLESLAMRIEVALKNLVSFQEQLTGPTGLETRFQEQIKGLSASIADAEAPSDAKPTDELLKLARMAMNDLPVQVSNLESDAYDVANPIYSLSDELQRIRQLRRGQSSAYDEVVSDTQAGVSTHSQFWDEFGSQVRVAPPLDADATVRLIAAAESEIAQELGRLTSELNGIESFGNNLKLEIEQEVTSVRTQLQDAEEAEKQAQKQLKEAYREAKSGAALNMWLVTAIILMIVAMVVLYLSLWLFRPALARTIIRQRVLIELLSMSFLLLTVIILGTGRLLDSTALSALLGTMTGYIFGRKTKRKKPEEAAASEDEQAPEPPTA